MTRVFRGHPGLLIRALPGALLVVAVKAGFVALGWQPLDFSPLLTGVIAAEIFIVGFLLTGTVADFKEAEHLPSEISASLETIADECLITHEDLAIPEARACLVQVVEIARAIRLWLSANRGFDDVLSAIRGLNTYFLAFAPKIQAGFTSRVKAEQATIRLKVLRIDTIRRTSFVSSVYLIGEVVGFLLVAVLLLTGQLGGNAPTLTMVGIVSFLLFYLFALIRELDNPFEYPDGKAGPTDVPVDVLERTEDRLNALLATMPAARRPL